MIKLDKFQKKALHDEHMLIIAPPGSGKTATAVGLINWLVEEEITEPDRILYLSFTNKAAKEGARRAGHDVVAKTIHSFCFNELRRYIDPDELKIATDEIIGMASHHCKDGYDDDINMEMIESYSLGYTTYEKAILEKIVKVYNYLHDHGFITFGDMLLKYDKLLDEKKYKPRKFGNIIVDEAQDLNKVQYQLIAKLAKRVRASLALVGDGMQVLYSWRGADPDVFDRFTKEFSPKLVELKNTYRCREAIVSVANTLSEDMDYGSEMIAIKDGGSCKTYTKYPYDLLINLRRNKDKNETIAGLFRTNRESLMTSISLKQNGYPYVFLKESNIADTAYGRDLRALIMTIMYPDDELSTKLFIKRVAKRMKLGLGQTGMDKFGTVQKMYDNLNSNKPVVKMTKKWEDIRDSINLLFKYNKDSTIADIIFEFNNWLNDELFRSKWVKEEFGENTCEQFLDYLNNMLFSDESSDDEEAKYPIRLGTVHAAKGLEYNHVVIGTEWYDNYFKRTNGTVDNDEKMVLYVAITRAIDTVSISTLTNNTITFFNDLLKRK